MKSNLNFAIAFIFPFFILNCTSGNGMVIQSSKSQEIFIIGTMHEVPKIVKNAYKPLLKIAKSYEPDAIYVERQRPSDSLSLANYESTYFLPLGDSLSTSFIEDKKRLDRLKATSVYTMTRADFEYLRQYYAVQKDKANYVYYSYLKTYGIQGSKKPLRNENYDLTAPLAIAMDINTIYSMDHQHETQLYSKLRKECYLASKEDGQLALLSKHNKKDYNKHIIPSIFGNLGIYSNRIKTMKRYEISNRLTFRSTPCRPCEEAAQVWDRRNAGMAKNIGQQVRENNHEKAIVIVGAGHVLGIKAELENQFPDLLISIIDE